MSKENAPICHVQRIETHPILGQHATERQSFDRAIEHYSKLGFQIKYRDEGFMILGRDAIKIQMNEDVDHIHGGSICYMTVRAIESIYEEISSKIPIDPCTGRRYLLNK